MMPTGKAYPDGKFYTSAPVILRRPGHVGGFTDPGEGASNRCPDFAGICIAAGASELRAPRCCRS